MNQTNLNPNADFKIEVCENVYWVPANALGKGQYGLSDITDIASMPPEGKRQRIMTLYDAVSLYQKSGFSGSIDNVRVLDDKTAVLWHFHKPGYHAVRTNTGCCAADSNWLCYMLPGKYDEIGCFGVLKDDGDGHIINFIKHDGKLYFIDMMMQRTDSLPFTGYESGDMSDFKTKDFTGFIFEAGDFKDFINYLRIKHPHKHVLYYKYSGECYAIGTQYYWVSGENGWDLCSAAEPKVVFKENSVEILHSDNSAIYGFASDTALEPNWSILDTYVLKSGN